MPFTYRARSAEAWDKRANQSSGDFDSFIKDGIKIFKPKKGSNNIRILPPTWDDPEHYGIDIYVHYSVGPTKASVICPQFTKNPQLGWNPSACPLCEARMKAVKAGEEEEAKELRSGKRVVTWVLDRNDEDIGPQVWPMSSTQDKEFAGLAKDDDGTILCLDDPDSGYDVSFEKQGEGIQTKYNRYKVSRKASQIDDAPLDFIEENPLPKILVWRSYAEIKELYEGSVAEDTSRKASSREEPEERVSRRRVTNGHDSLPDRVRGQLNTQERGRSKAPPEAEEGRRPAVEREFTRRRVEPSEDRPRASRQSDESRTIRDDINDEIPFDRIEKRAAAQEEDTEAAPKSVTDKLRDRFSQRR